MKQINKKLTSKLGALALATGIAATQAHADSPVTGLVEYVPDQRAYAELFAGKKITDDIGCHAFYFVENGIDDKYTLQMFRGQCDYEVADGIRIGGAAKNVKVDTGDVDTDGLITLKLDAPDKNGALNLRYSPATNILDTFGAYNMGEYYVDLLSSYNHAKDGGFANIGIGKTIEEINENFSLGLETNLNINDNSVDHDYTGIRARYTF